MFARSFLGQVTSNISGGSRIFKRGANGGASVNLNLVISVNYFVYEDILWEYTLMRKSFVLQNNYIKFGNVK